MAMATNADQRKWHQICISAVSRDRRLQRKCSPCRSGSAGRPARSRYTSRHRRAPRTGPCPEAANKQRIQARECEEWGGGWKGGVLGLHHSSIDQVINRSITHPLSQFTNCTKPSIQSLTHTFIHTCIRKRNQRSEGFQRYRRSDINLSLSLPEVINFKFLLQPQQKYYITQYKELGVPYLTPMKDDYAYNSPYIIYTFLFKRLGECTYVLNLGAGRLLSSEGRLF